MTSSGAIALTVVAVVVGLLLLRFARQIALFLLRLGLVGAAVILAPVALEQVLSSRQTDAVPDLGLLPTVLIVILVVLLLIAVAVIGYLVLRLQMTKRRWLPGPEARWRQTGQPRREEVPPMPYPLQPYGPPYPQQQYPSPQVLPTFYVLENPDEDDSEDVPWEDGWW